jgi:hypothetical protein
MYCRSKKITDQVHHNIVHVGSDFSKLFNIDRSTKHHLATEVQNMWEVSMEGSHTASHAALPIVTLKLMHSSLLSHTGTEESKCLYIILVLLLN